MLHLNFVVVNAIPIGAFHPLTGAVVVRPPSVEVDKKYVSFGVRPPVCPVTASHSPVLAVSVLAVKMFPVALLAIVASNTKPIAFLAAALSARANFNPPLASQYTTWHLLIVAPCVFCSADCVASVTEVTVLPAVALPYVSTVILL